MRQVRQWLGVLVVLLGVDVAHAAAARVEQLRIDAAGAETRLTLLLSDPRPYQMFTLSDPDRLVLDIARAHLASSALPLPGGAGVIRQLRVANRPDGSVRVVLDLSARAEPQGVMRQASGAAATEITIDLATARRPAVPAPPVISALVPAAEMTAPATPLAAMPEPHVAGQSAGAPPAVESSAPAGQMAVAPAEAVASKPAPLAREAVAVVEAGRVVAEAAPAVARESAPIGRDLIIAVDAGHGGKDPGAHGPRGVREKDVTLLISRLLAERIDAEPGMRGVLTRKRDEFVPLRERMERARAAKADLFVSIHADAVHNRGVRGASVYVLNEKGATDEAARRLAARENAADLIGGVSLGIKDRTLASVLLDLSQNASLGSSIEVADSILAEMARVGTVRKPRVMQAPFMVLKSPDVPSVLIETAYISNPDEERRLNSHAYRERLAGAVLAGIRDYFYRNPPQGTLVAELSRRQRGGAVTHVTQRGESLAEIASRYNTSVRRIRDANQLKSDRIVVGQVLRIPASRDS